MLRLSVRGCRANWPMCAALLAALLCRSSAGLADDFALRQQEAFRASVDRVAPAVVRIETVGGFDRIGRRLLGNAATTGLIVAGDGYIVSSAFNFVQKPNSILVTLPDRSKEPARLLATDHNRMLVLLKVEAKQPLPVPEAAPASTVQVGQWAIAIGRTFDANRPNLSVGIVSGLKRIWGKAIQTDAKISPANYGGPLIDLQGRVLGVLVPLSPDSTSEVAGAEWYDSGIGFAIPLEQINEILPRLKQGDLQSGVLGISLPAGSPFGQPATIASVRPNSPAAKVGLKPGDTIIGAAGQSVASQAQLRSQLNPLYAGDKLPLVVLRGKERIEVTPELVAVLQAYQHPFLGILPLRGKSGPGVVVRAVFPDSPAAKAGIVAGDRLLSLAGHVIDDRNSAWQALSTLEPGQKIAIRVRHGEQENEREIELARLDGSMPSDLPPAHDKVERESERPANTGPIEIKVPEFANRCLAYVPEDFSPGETYGAVLWLHGPGGLDREKLMERWREVCDSRELILVAPEAAEIGAWKPAEVDFIYKALRQVMSTYTIDPARVVAAGEGTGATLAYLMAFKERETFHGVVAVNGAPAGRLPENDPIYRLSIYAIVAGQSQAAKQSAAAVEHLREAKFPVTTHEMQGQQRELNHEELMEIGRWIDTLDRI